MSIVLYFIAAYFIGAIPTGYIITKMLKGIDIRQHGSGNPGATNVFRVVGPVPGIITFILDALKGYMPAIAVMYAFPRTPSFALIAGLLAITGHMLTVFLRFKGGKGVATACGVFFALLPLPTLLALLVFAVTLAASKYVSLGSILASLALPLFAWILNAPLPSTIFALIIGIAIIIKHKSNIQRLMAGTENKITAKKA